MFFFLQSAYLPVSLTTGSVFHTSWWGCPWWSGWWVCGQGDGCSWWTRGSGATETPGNPSAPQPGCSPSIFQTLCAESKFQKKSFDCFRLIAQILYTCFSTHCRTFCLEWLAKEVECHFFNGCGLMTPGLWNIRGQPGLQGNGSTQRISRMTKKTPLSKQSDLRGEQLSWLSLRTDRSYIKLTCPPALSF